MANKTNESLTQAKPQMIPLSKIYELANVFNSKPQDKTLDSMVLSIESNGIKELLLALDGGVLHLLLYQLTLINRPGPFKNISEQRIHHCVDFLGAVCSRPFAYSGTCLPAVPGQKGAAGNEAVT